MKKYFSNDPCGAGLEFHETAEAARAAAQEALDGERDHADEGWSEEVNDICWGEIVQCAVETSRRPFDPDKDAPTCPGTFDEFVDYGLEYTGTGPREVTAPEAAGILNRALAADPSAIAALLNHRVSCSLALAEDETIQCGHPGDDPTKGLEVGLLGIINGIFGIRPNHCGYIVAECDTATGHVHRFYAVDNEGNEVSL